MIRTLPWIAAAALATLIPGAAAHLELHPAAGWNWELLWRGIGCHFTHFTLSHWLYDAGAMLVLGMLLTGRELNRALLTAIPMVTLAVVLLTPDLAIYRGLSGLDCALFAAVVVKLWRSEAAPGRWAAGLAAVVFLLKTVWELATGATVFVGGGVLFEAVPVAHIAGAIAGFCAEAGLPKWEMRHIVRSLSKPLSEGAP